MRGGVVGGMCVTGQLGVVELALAVEAVEGLGPADGAAAEAVGKGKTTQPTEPGLEDDPNILRSRPRAGVQAGTQL